MGMPISMIRETLFIFFLLYEAVYHSRIPKSKSQADNKKPYYDWGLNPYLVEKVTWVK